MNRYSTSSLKGLSRQRGEGTGGDAAVVDVRGLVREDGELAYGVALRDQRGLPGAVTQHLHSQITSKWPKGLSRSTSDPRSSLYHYIFMHMYTHMHC